MKSVCMLVQNYYEIDVRVRRKAEALVAAGYAVDVLALRSSYSQRGTYTLEGVTVHTLALGKNRGSLLRYALEYAAFFLWALVKLVRMMPTRHYVAIDVNTLPDFLVFAAAPARWMGASIILDMHEITPEFYMSKYGIEARSPVVRLLTWLERRSFAFADQVITINAPILKLLVGRGLDPGKATVIMNAVDESLFDAVRRPGPAEPGHGFADRPAGTIMMYHGTLTRIYGLDIAIEAFALAQPEMPGAQLWIIGDGPERRALERLATKLGCAQHVRFMGAVLPEEIPRWVDQCDVGVLPTRRDVFLDYSFSNKLSEYIVMHKAAIVARLAAIRHYFSDEALVYFEPNDPDDLARQMTRLNRDPQLRLRHAERARQEYEPIRWSVMKQRYLELMNRLGERAGARAPTRHGA